jgi:NADH:ubiquinone oxidoreductase subunit 6 (subunit J)
MLIGVGIMFLLANSEIMFAMQISIYGGGIAVLLLFAVLLTEHDDHQFPSSIMGFVKVTWTQLIIFVTLAANLIFLSVTSVISTDYLDAIGAKDLGPSDLGDTTRPVHDDGATADAFEVTRNYALYLWKHFGEVIPFLALLLLAALLGSIKLVIREWEIEELSEEMSKRMQSTEVTQ